MVIVKNAYTNQLVSGMATKIHLIPAFETNYVFAMHDDTNNVVAIVDPGDAAPVFAWLEEQKLKPTHILLTHHHGDHIGGVDAIREKYACEVIGHKNDAARLPKLNKEVVNGDHFTLDSHDIEVLELPGHTIGHIAFYIADLKALFIGDTLFSMGCGRLFEGTFEQMFHSLNRIETLPENTQIYCAHEYTLKNAEFALTVDPANSNLQQRFDEALKMRQKKIPTIPTNLGLEKDTNPFLRSDSEGIREHLKMPDASDLEVFTKIRQLRNEF